eukprot:4559877-Pleurochrysis_carterae.AAC.2
MLDEPEVDWTMPMAVCAWSVPHAHLSGFVGLPMHCETLPPALRHSSEHSALECDRPTMSESLSKNFLSGSPVSCAALEGDGRPADRAPEREGPRLVDGEARNHGARLRRGVEVRRKPEQDRVRRVVLEGPQGHLRAVGRGRRELEAKALAARRRVASDQVAVEAEGGAHGLEQRLGALGGGARAVAEKLEAGNVGAPLNVLQRRLGGTTAVCERSHLHSVCVGGADTRFTWRSMTARDTRGPICKARKGAQRHALHTLRSQSTSRAQALICHISSVSTRARERTHRADGEVADEGVASALCLVARTQGGEDCKAKKGL